VRRRDGSLKRSSESSSRTAEGAGPGRSRPRARRAKAGTLALLLLCSLFPLYTQSKAEARSAEKILLERSAKRKPGWIVRPPESDRFLYVTGVATGARSLAEGSKAASLSAVEHILIYLGLQATSRYLERRSAYAAELESALESRALGSVRGGRAAEVYFERYRERGGSTDLFDVYVLFRVPLSEIEAERARLASEREAAAAEARAALALASPAALAADFSSGVLGLTRAHRNLAGLDPASPLLGRIEASLWDLAARLSVRIEEIELVAGSGSARRRVRVSASLLGAAGPMPVRNAPLQVEIVQGLARSEGKAVTGEDGNLAVEIALSGGGERGGTVRARLDRAALGGGPSPAGSEGGLASALAALEKIEGTKLLPAVSRAAAPVEEPRAPEPKARASAEPPSEDGTIEIRTGLPMKDPDRDGLALPVLVRLRAPPVSSRPPLDLALVLDASGSMADPRKLGYLKKAAELAVRHLAETDLLSVVTFGTEPAVLLPAQPFPGRRFLLHRLEMLEPRGRTNLSGGIEEALGQLLAKRRPFAAARIVVLTDGQANEGIVDPAGLEGLARRAREAGVPLSAIGLGDDADRALLRRIAAAGGGNFHYAERPEDLPVILSRETELLSGESVGEIEISIEPAEGVWLGRTYGYPVRLDNDGLAISAGSLPAGDWRTVVFELRRVCEEGASRAAGAVTVRFRDWQQGGRWRAVRRELPANCSAASEEIGPGEGNDVNVHARLLRALETLELALNMADPHLAAAARRFAREEEPSLRAEAEALGDRDLLDLLALYRHGMGELDEHVPVAGAGGLAHALDGDEARAANDFACRLYLIRHYGAPHGLLRPD